MSDARPRLVAAAVDPLVAAEHPGLRVWTARVAGAAGAHAAASCASACALPPTAAAAPQAVALRTRPVPWAYRVLFRHLGLDPDVHAHAGRGARRSSGCCTAASRARGLPEDALALATLETGVPVWALDARRRRRARRSRPARTAGSCSPTTRGTVAVLFCAARRRSARRAARTRALLLVAVQAPGVDDLVRRGGAVDGGRRAPVPLTPRHDRPRRSRARRAARGAARARGARRRAGGVQHLNFKYGPVKIAPGQNTIEIERQPAQAAGRRLDHRLPAEPRRYKDGSVPRVDVIHLHHGVWLTNLQPLFAAGEEKTEFAAPPGYGWRYRTTDQWHMNHMIHNLTPTPDRGLHHLRARLRARRLAGGGGHAGDRRRSGST